MWKRRIAIYLFGVVLGILVVSRFPVGKRQVVSSHFVPTADHEHLAEATWSNLSQAPSAEDLSGRILLLFFIDSNCLSCAKWAESAQQWQTRFAHDLLVLVVSAEGNMASFPSFWQQTPFVLDAEQKLRQTFAIPQVPAFVILRPDGQRMKTYSSAAFQPQEVLDDLFYLHQLFINKSKNSSLKW